MKKLWIAVVSTLAALCTFLVFTFSFAMQRETASDVSSSYKNASTKKVVISKLESTMVARGEYLARSADCIACHTAPGGKPFAGGLQMQTPIGSIYSSNITPDKNTGIGTYTFADFDMAVRYGIRPDGQSLYPAMPYPSYSRISDADMLDLYAYFMDGVAPVTQQNRNNAIPWPLSMRWPLAIWQRIFVPSYVPTQFAPDETNALLRGAYLAESLGHCGACHTPRSITMNEKVLSDSSTLYLSGSAPIDGWVAPNLRGDPVDGLGGWSVEDIVAFLRAGRNTKATAFGGMAEVVKDSTQYMSDSDLNALALYLKSLTAVKNPTITHKVDATTKALRLGDVSQPGALIYVNRCAACHRSSGGGAEGVFPALAGNPVLLSDDATSVIHIVLTGDTLPATKTAPSSFVMPGFADQMTNSDVAEVVNFIRNSWGNKAAKISASDVAKVRAGGFYEFNKPQSKIVP